MPLERITIVLATWCPHCVPLSRDMAKKMADDIHVPLRVLDIDQPDELKLADEIVKLHGDWAEDYIIPQVFAEFSDGRVKHFFTGSSEGTQVTRSRWDNLFQSQFFEKLKEGKSAA